MAETPVISSMLMDRSEPLGNSPDDSGRRRLHTKITNAASEPLHSDIVPVTSARIAVLTVDSTQWVALPAVAFSNRHVISIQNQSVNKTLFLNYDSGAALGVGYALDPGATREILLAASVTIYARAEAGASITVCVEELAL